MTCISTEKTMSVILGCSEAKGRCGQFSLFCIFRESREIFFFFRLRHCDGAHDGQTHKPIERYALAAGAAESRGEAMRNTQRYGRVLKEQGLLRARCWKIKAPT